MENCLTSYSHVFTLPSLFWFNILLLFCCIGDFSIVLIAFIGNVILPLCISLFFHDDIVQRQNAQYRLKRSRFKQQQRPNLHHIFYVGWRMLRYSDGVSRSLATRLVEEWWYIGIGFKFRSRCEGIFQGVSTRLNLHISERGG